MTNIKLFLFLILFFALSKVNAQPSVKPKFKRLLCVSYRIKKPNDQKIAQIEQYFEVNENGQAILKIKYFNGVVDTSYQLSDTSISKLNKIFDGTKELGAYMIKDKFPNGTFYAGPVRFIKYSDDKNIDHTFIIVPPFMNQDINDLLEDVVYRPSQFIYKTKTIQNKPIENEILQFQKACKYLSQVGDSPDMQFLINPHN